MKKFILPMAALSLIAAAACTKNEFDSQNVQNNEGRTVLTVELPGETKTILGDAQGDVRPVLWSKGDQISVNGVASQALNIESNAASADFTLNAELTAPYSIIYPATMVKDGSSVITLPSQQKFASGDNIVSGSLPMAGYSNTLSAKMGQLCGILGIHLKAGSQTGLIRYIEVTATGGEPVSGDFSVDCHNCKLSSEAQGVNVIRMEVQKALSTESASAFNVILPAGVYSQGFSVKVVDENGQAMIRNIGGSLELEAGKLMLMPELTFVPNGEEKGVEIATPEDWNAFATAYNAGKYPDSQIATITADLNFSSVSADQFVTLGLRDGAKQSPNGSTKYFAGTLNGNGKKILNLKTDVPFIQAIGTGALVQDINIDETCSFTPWYGGEKQLEFGSLIGYCSNGTVKNCTSAASITVSQCNAVANKVPLYIGGLIGRNRSASISDCTSSATIMSDATYVTDATAKTSLYIGGFTGYCSNPDGVLEKCTNTGNISVASTASNIYVGGICAKTSAGTITGCTNSGTITVSTVRAAGDPCKFIYLGGLFSVVDASGDEQYLKVIECSNSGDITSNSNVKQLIAGGIAAHLSTNKAVFTNTTNAGNITTTAALRNLFCGGLFGRVSAAQTLNLSGEPSTGAINIGTTESNKYVQLYCGGLIGQTTEEVTVSGDVTYKSNITYDISSGKNIAAESFFGGIIGCAYGAPINISGMNASGNVKVVTAKKVVQHKISGLGGIIGGATAGATISDCISSVYVQMTAKTSDAAGNSIHIGGIAGRLYGGKVEIKHCKNGQRQAGMQLNQNPWTNYDANAVGGIVGSIGYSNGNTYKAIIEDCHNTGSVYAYCGTAGGIAGYVSNGTITDCTYIAEKGITRSAPGGGIAGVAEKCKISSCDVKINTDGIAVDGNGTKATADAGGIIGEAVASSVDGCRYWGTIAQTNATTAAFGGIIGKADDASSAGVTTTCGFGGTINGTTITEETDLSTYAIGSTTGTRGTFYLWDGTL